MIRPPSNIGTYDEFYSKDSDIRQPQPDGSDADEVANLIRVARETGEWQPLISGPSPTKFIMRVIPGSLFRKLVDGHTAGEYGETGFSAMTVRIALIDIVLPGCKFKTCNHPVFGKIADESMVDLLDSIDMKIVNELSNAAINRVQLRPKS